MQTLCISTCTKSGLEVQILDYMHRKPPRRGLCYDFLCIGSFCMFPPLYYEASLAYLILSISCDSPILMNMVLLQNSATKASKHTLQNSVALDKVCLLI